MSTLNPVIRIVGSIALSCVVVLMQMASLVYDSPRSPLSELLERAPQ